MDQPLEFTLSACTHNTFGGHSTLSVIPNFLLENAPAFGSAIKTIELYLHFPTAGPPRKTLERLYANFHANRLKLPRVTIQRSREKVEIVVASDLIDGGGWELRRGLSASLFTSSFGETLTVLRLLRLKLKASDDFRLDAFLLHCEERRADLPSTDEDLTKIKTRL